MNNDVETMLDLLVAKAAGSGKIRSIGLSGKSVPAMPGDADIDLFVYCSSIPEEEERRAIYAGLNIGQAVLGAIGGGHWGTGDSMLVCGVESWLMYFTQEEAEREIMEVLNGAHPGRFGTYYYPVGRCATIRGMTVMLDKDGFLASLRNKLLVYPDALAEIIIKYHSQCLRDTEDLERAVKRGDVLFYHFAIDLALDHFLQALFALNKEFFPSRKRSPEYIARFLRRPDGCEGRLLEILRLAAGPETLGASFAAWQKLSGELLSLCGA